MPDLSVVLIYPELLGLYADRGNALALGHRARLRGWSCEVVEVAAGEAVPEGADIYLLGGGEDAAMVPTLELLRAQSGLPHAIDRGAVVLGVCAGFQLLGRRFSSPDGVLVDGLGHLDVESRSLPGRRAVGEVLVRSEVAGELQGFENHRGDARLGADATPLGTLVRGMGNGDGATEGAVQDNVIGTYLHGPALVRNPDLADVLLARAAGVPLAPVTDELVERLRAERRAVTGGRLSWWAPR
ncbi:glutamine amidotransferase [Nocardioides maradonensis]